MRALFICLCLLLSVSSFAKSEIIETLEYSEIFKKISSLGEKYGPEEVLVVFDIDDTLLVIEHCKKPDGTLTRGIGKLFRCPSVHTEKNLSHQIEAIQEQGFPTIALTARGASLVKATQRELARKHSGLKTFSFEGKPFSKDILKIAVERTRRCKQGETAPCLKGEVTTKPRFVEGVMYANGSHKGLALEALLELKEVSYSAIVFIDDRKKNTDNVHALYRQQEATEVVNYLYLRHRD